MIMSGYDFLKRQVLSCWPKVESVCDVVISSEKVKSHSCQCNPINTASSYSSWSIHSYCVYMSVFCHYFAHAQIIPLSG